MAYPDEGVVKGWRLDWLKCDGSVTEDLYIAERAVDWERDACCEWVKNNFEPESAEHLRLFRLPKPPSLKEQALEALKHAEEGWRPVPDDCALIRRALESLPD